jgi:hypothetical protein
MTPPKAPAILTHVFRVCLAILAWSVWGAGAAQAQEDIDIDQDGVPDFALNSFWVEAGRQYPGKYAFGYDRFQCYRSNAVYVFIASQVPAAYRYPVPSWVETPQRGHGWSPPGSSHVVQDYGQERQPITEPPFSGNFAFRRGALAGYSDLETVFYVVRFMTADGWRLGWIHLPMFREQGLNWDYMGPDIMGWRPNPFERASIFPIGYGYSKEADLTQFNPGYPPLPQRPQLTLKVNGGTNAHPHLYFEVTPGSGWQQVECSWHPFGADWVPAGPGFTNSIAIPSGVGTEFFYPSQQFFRLR